MTTWLNETETTVHSTLLPPLWPPDRKTCSGTENPEPMIDTRVFPSLEPEEGMTAVMFGVPVPTVPKAKQLGTERVIGELFARNVSVIEVGVELDVASGKAGVITVTDEAVTAVTGASRVM